LGIDYVEAFNIEGLTEDKLRCRANPFIIHENALAGKRAQSSASDV
jgi:hypothetical protein